MKRALPTLGMTGVGVGLLLSFDTRSPKPQVVTTGTASVAVATGSAPPTTSSSSPASSSTSAPPATSAPAVTDASAPTTVSGAPPAAAGTASTAPAAPVETTTTAPPAPATTLAPAPIVYSIDGPVADTRWGPVQVQITVQDGAVVEVVALQTPFEHRKSVGINEWAVPALREAALVAQSASIDVVSGATVTWGGYTASLQAALDAVPR